MTRKIARNVGHVFLHKFTQKINKAYIASTRASAPKNQNQRKNLFKCVDAMREQHSSSINNGWRLKKKRNLNRELCQATDCGGTQLYRNGLSLWCCFT